MLQSLLSTLANTMTPDECREEAKNEVGRDSIFLAQYQQTKALWEIAAQMAELVAYLKTPK